MAAAEGQPFISLSYDLGEQQRTLQPYFTQMLQLVIACHVTSLKTKSSPCPSVSQTPILCAANCPRYGAPRLPGESSRSCSRRSTRSAASLMALPTCMLTLRAKSKSVTLASKRCWRAPHTCCHSCLPSSPPRRNSKRCRWGVCLRHSGYI